MASACSSSSYPLTSPSKSSPALFSPFFPALSPHSYRQPLSCTHSPLLNYDDHKGKTLRRKNAAVDLSATATAQMGSLYQFHHQHQHAHHNAYYQFGASSVTSSSPPPPLSPSYSPSALSEQSELLDPVPLSPVVDGQYYRYENEGDKNYKLLDTFRDRLAKFPGPDPDTDTPDVVELYGHGHGHSRTRSDSALFRTRRARKPKPQPATVVHQGTSFEILNPHESLDFARIVSYIEDVDCHASVHQRDSYLYCSDEVDIDIIHEDPCDGDEFERPAEEKTHDDLVGDSPHRPMPSISERLGDPDTESCYSSIRAPSRPLSMIVRPWTAHSHNEPDLGEPGPPIYDETDPNPSLGPRPLPNTHSPSPDLDHDLDLDPAHLAALYNIDISSLPAPGKGTDNLNPTAVIYSDLNVKPLRKRSTIQKPRHRTRARKIPSSSSSFSLNPSSVSVSAAAASASATASAPLKRLRGIAQTLRRKTFQRTSLSS